MAEYLERLSESDPVAYPSDFVMDAYEEIMAKFIEEMRDRIRELGVKFGWRLIAGSQ